MPEDPTPTEGAISRPASPRRIILTKTAIHFFGLICFFYVVGHHISKELDRPFTFGFAANIAFLFIAYYVSLMVHELGHALVGRCLGLRVFRVTLGSGRPLWRFRIGATQLVIGTIPAGGSTWFTPNSEKAARLRVWLGTLAGPLANAFVVLAVSAYYSGSWVLYDIVDHFTPAGTLVFSNAWAMLWSLLPFRTSMGVGRVRTDGRILLSLPFMKDKEFQEHLAALYAMEATEAISEGSIESAGEILQRGLERYPNSLVINLAKGVLRLENRDFIGARSAFEELMSSDDLESQLRDMIKNNIAWTDVFLEGEERHHNAYELISDVYKRNSQSGWANGTLGAAMVQTGKIRDGIGHLLKAFTINDGDISLAHNACWLSVAHARLGELEEARRYLEEGRKLHPSSYSIPLAESELAKAEAKLGSDS